MKTSLLVLAATLSLVSSSKTHRISIRRVDSGSDSTREHVDRTLARYSNNKVTHDSANSNRPLSRFQVQRNEPEDSSRRSKWIDASRMPLEYNPSQVAFVGGVGIGTPPQYFNLEFDIGMADTWVTSEKANCTTSGMKCSAESHRFFHPSISTTFDEAPNVPWKMETIANAKIQGVLHTDRINVAGFVVEKQVLGTATILNNVKENGIDGSFGLGLNAMTFNGDPTPIDNLIESGTMKSEAKLDRVGVWMGTGNQGGELIFGGRDPLRYAGDMSYFNVPEGSVYWATPVQALQVVIREPETDQGGPTGKIKVMTHDVPSRIGFGTGLSMPNVIFDTSSNVILVPPRVALTVHQKIHNSMFGWYSGYNIFAGAYTISCSLLDEPSFDIWIELGPTATKARTTAQGGDVSAASVEPSGDNKAFGGNSTTTTDAPVTKGEPTDAEQKPLQPPLPQPISPPTSTPQTLAPETPEYSSTNRRFRIAGKDLVRESVPFLGSIFNICYSGIQPSKTDDDDWVFGNIWFMNNYMTLDHLNSQIGVAASHHDA
ncbi:hypothetical protein BGZ74_003665 [Mortierella antarctica]|nr:hypothetical protein BGZ74_003665 [Mortierella antarctica]